MIGAKAPSDYLSQIQGHKNIALADGEMDRLLRTHCLDPKPLREDDYDGFIESRRALLLERISEAMGKAVLESGEAVAEDDVEDESEAAEKDASGWDGLRRSRPRVWVREACFTTRAAGARLREVTPMRFGRASVSRGRVLA